MSKKKKKKVQEPAYYTSATNAKTLNYNVYQMKVYEKIAYILLAFCVGFLIGLLFYGGIGTNSRGQATRLTYILNAIIPSIIGIIAVRIFLPVRKKQLISKRKEILRKQFSDMLESLSVSVSAGQNVPMAFQSVKHDLMIQYEEDSYIVQEVNLILKEISNGIPIENLLRDLGRRSAIKDISDFGQVFSISYRKGGDIKNIIYNCHKIISDKIEIEIDIETKVASSKNQQMIMCVMPVVIVAIMKMSGGEMSKNFTSLSGVIATTVSIGIFVAAYFIGRKILDIQI